MASLRDALAFFVSKEDLNDLLALLAQRVGINNSVNQFNYDVAQEVVSAPGAIGLEAKTTLLEVDGTDAFTLADGTAGQVKVIVCTVAANTPAGTLTPANFGNGTSILFNAVGETVTLEFRSGNWWITSVDGATPS